MISKASIAAAATLLVVGLMSLPAEAQADKAPEPKGVAVRALVAPEVGKGSPPGLQATATSTTAKNSGANSRG